MPTDKPAVGAERLLHHIVDQTYKLPLCSNCGYLIRELIASAAQAVAAQCPYCPQPKDAHWFTEPWPDKRGHCGKCGKPNQFADGICFACNGGRDPGD
jgi:hypothetical protein